jgi:DNA repair exonuclease SbcCD ATPase subunit
MHVQKIILKNFMNHRDTVVSFPESGITLITGDNGAGKSAIGIESIATAFWGKTFRKAAPWREDTSGSVTITTDDLEIARSKTPKTSPKLKFLDSKHATTTKGQDALERLVGDWDTWRRVAVFSSQDVAHFTLATDAERKRLIEGLLGIDRFDPALKACRTNLKAAQNEALAYETIIKLANERLKGNKQRLADAQDGLQLIGDPDELDVSDAINNLQEKEKEISEYITQCDNDIREINKKIREATSGVATAEADVKHAQKEAGLLKHEKCYTCKRSIDVKLRKHLQDAVQAALQKADDAKADSAETVQLLEETLEELQEEVSGLSDREAAVGAEISALRQAERANKKDLEAKQRYERIISEVQKEEAGTKEEIEENEEKLDAADETTAVLKATEQVLGLEGVRAHIIGHTLKGIEAISNTWLTKIAGQGLSLELKPYSEKESGGVKDKISLKIHGAGGGRGYFAASTGERRRIDVALLFALGEIAAAARGVTQDDVFIDEVADGLDAEGRAAISEALCELAENRSIIVITHNEELARMLQPVQHLHITTTGKENIPTVHIKKGLNNESNTDIRA